MQISLKWVNELVNIETVNLDNLIETLMKEKNEINIDEEIRTYSKNLPVHKDNTQNIIEYVKQTDKKKKKTKTEKMS